MPFQYELRAIAANGLPGDLITYLDIEEAEFISTIGRAGTFSATALKPFQDMVPRRLYPWFEPGASAIWVMREPEAGEAISPQYVWAGMIQDISGSSDDSTISITAEEFTSMYDRLILLDDFTGNNVDKDAVQLVKDLVNFYPFGINLPFSSAPGTTSGVIQRPRWFRYEARNIGDLIRSLCTTGGAASENFEYCQRVKMNDGGSNPTAAYFHVGIPTVVTVPGTLVKLEYGPDTLETCRKVDYQYSARQAITRISVRGFGERGSQIYNHIQSTTTRGLVQMDDVAEDQNLRSQGAVDNWGIQLIRQRGRPVPSIKAWVPIDRSKITFGSFGLGDELFCRFYDPYFKWRGFLRVTGFGMRIINHASAEYVVELNTAVSSLALLADTIP